MATRLDRRIAASELDRLPHEWDTRYELVGGVLYMSRRPPLGHQRIATRLLLSLGPPVLARDGEVLVEPGVVWDDDGDDNVAPDLAVVLSEKPPDTGKLRRCPEIVVEIVSPGADNRRRDYEAKRALYYDRGAHEYWIVDPEERSVHVLTRGESGWNESTLRDDDRLTSALVPVWAGIIVRDLL
jgi:Uma2 family endonuclease